MCYHPVRILNPKFKSCTSSFSTTQDRIYLEVPCGCCGECRQRKIKEFQVRNYYESLYTHKYGGFVFFDTFTYDDQHVPEFHGLKCFDKRHYRYFMQKLRNTLRSRGYDPSRGNLKVMWCSEYGGQTYRPHYHALFYVNFDISIQEFDEIVNLSWTDKNGFSIGFTQTSNPFEPKYYNLPERCILNFDNKYNSEDLPQGAVDYVSKYLCKDYDFIEVINNQKNSDFQTYFKKKYAMLFGEEYYSPDITYTDLFKVFSASSEEYILPFHCQTQGLGASILDLCSDDDIKSGTIPLPDKNKVTDFVRVPLYIDRKRFYTYDKVTRLYRLTDEGKVVFADRAKGRPQMVFDNFSKVFNTWYVGVPQLKLIDVYSDLNDMFIHRGFDVKVNSPGDVNLFIKQLLGDFTLTHLVNYCIFFKDRVINDDFVFDLCDHSFYYNMLLASQSLPEYNDDKDYCIRNSYSSIDVQLTYFDLIFDIFRVLRSVSGTDRQRRYLLQAKERARDKLVTSIYKNKI